jgi:transcriptional regulator with XRE-family HTH domain
MLSPIANDRLRARRHAAGLTETQVAEAVARLVSAQTGRRAALDGNYVSKLERGRITWPNRAYRHALRVIFDVPTDADLGFYAARTRRDAERWRSAPEGQLSRVGRGRT